MTLEAGFNPASRSRDIKELKDCKPPKKKGDWDSVYEELVSSIAVNDDIPILEASSNEATNRLRQWLLNQKNKLHELNEDQRTKIQGIIHRFDNELALSLEVTTKKTCSLWLRNYKEMNREIDRIGIKKVVSPIKSENHSIAIWVTNQKVKMRDNKLAQWQISLLQKSGIKPAAKNVKAKPNAKYEKRWNENYELLKAFKKRTGHCIVPVKLNWRLSKWVHKQKKYLENKNLRPDRTEKLEAIGLNYEN